MKELVGPTIWVVCPACGQDFSSQRLAELDSLDAAWAEAEAALPEGWFIDSLSMVGLDDRWQAWAESEDRASIVKPGDEEKWEAAEAPTPAAALRALVAKLREVGR